MMYRGQVDSRVSKRMWEFRALQARQFFCLRSPAMHCWYVGPWFQPAKRAKER